MSIESLFARPAALPMVPKVVARLMRSFDRDDVALDEIASQLAADPVLSAKVLRLANSAYFQVARRVESIDEALRLLGFDIVRQLVFSAGLAQAFKTVPGVDLPQFWRHSLHTACVARWLAGAMEQSRELAFTVGLLHALGHLVLHLEKGDALQELDRRVPMFSAGRAAAEREAFGYHHGDVGAVLAMRWQLPATIAEPLRAIPRAGEESAPVELLVHVAAWRARAETLRLSGEQVAAGAPLEVARGLGYELRWLAAQQTLALRPLAGGDEVTMPPLAQLCGGLEPAF